MSTTARTTGALAFLVSLGVAGSPAFGQGPPPPDTSVRDEYRIQAGDELDIKFYYNAELNERVIVRPDGRISLQLIPELVVTGQSPSGLSHQLMNAYAAELKQPQVTVIVRAFGAERVYVDGEVGRPGMIPLTGRTTVLQAISQAGGFKDAARLSEVIVVRSDGGAKPTPIRLNLKAARRGTAIEQDALLRPLDIVFVPRSRIGNVNKWVDEYVRKNLPLPLGVQFGIFR